MNKYLKLAIFLLLPVSSLTSILLLIKIIFNYRNQYKIDASNSYQVNNQLTVIKREVENLTREVQDLKSTLTTSQSGLRSNRQRIRSQNNNRNQTRNAVSDVGESDGYLSVHSKSKAIKSDNFDSDDDDFYDLSDTNPETIISKPEINNNNNNNNDDDDDNVDGNLCSEVDIIDLECQNELDTCQTYVTKLRHANSQELINVGLLWRHSRCLIHLVAHVKRMSPGNVLDEPTLLTEAMEICHRAIQTTEECWEAHKWYAISAGMLSQCSSSTEQARLGTLYRTHISRAMEISATEPTLYYLMGVWYFNISQLAWITRNAARTLYGSAYNGTIEDAERMFKQAETLSPGFWKQNQLYLAKCAMVRQNRMEFSDWLNRAYTLEVKSPDDREAHNEIQQLATKHSIEFK